MTKRFSFTNKFPRPLRERGKNAFTLAEVLITLAIIGVVAAMTIPTLIAEYNQKSWDTASTVFNRRLGEALAMMNTTSSLAGYSTTADFVEELGKHIKITKTCTSDKLTECFTSTITTTGDPVETKDLKASKNLYSTEDYGTETIGVQFADGVSALIAYNPKATQDPLSNQVVRLTGSKDSVGLSTDAISILYDVSGGKTPNQMDAGKDIRGINIAIKTGATVKLIGTGYDPVNCADSTSDGYEYCTAGDISSAYTSNYWAGAKKKCAELGMSLPERGSLASNYCTSDAAENTLCGLYNNREALGLPSSGRFWPASEINTNSAWYVDFSNGYAYRYFKDTQYRVVCVGN